MRKPSQMSLSHLKFRHLMLIRLLQELGTVHKAAQALNISQPAATAMLNDVESLMGFTLFARNHRGAQVTDQGRLLLDTLNRLLNEFHDFSNTIDQIQQGGEPLLRVGAVPQAYATYLPQAIALFRKQGGTRVQAKEGTGQQLLSELLAGNLDCVIGRMPTTAPTGWNLSALSFENLYAEEICIVAGLGSPALPRTRSPYIWLGAQEWVLQRSDSSVRAALNEAFLRAGVKPPEPLVETTNYIQSLALAAKMAAFTVAPRGPAELQERSGTVHILKIDLKVSPMLVSFIHRLVSGESRQVMLLRDCLRQAVQ